jgi:3-(3-hydroxy-phenyl)propionate hydroxylase
MTTRGDILIVGAGPVGLTAALAVRSTGRPVRVLEAGAADRLRPGSRAIYLHGATLKILERLSPGLGHALARGGIVWPTRRTTYKGHTVFQRTYKNRGETADGLPHFTSLSQVEAEHCLLAACHAAGVEFIWNRTAQRADVTGDTVEISTDTGDVYHGAYVIAADGARSAIRESIGIELEGTRSINTFVIADVAEIAESPLPVERVFHYRHPQVGGRNVLLVPFAGGWRADLQLRVDDDPKQFSEGEGLRNWLAATLGPAYADRVTWVSNYQFLQVIAGSFCDPTGRVLLVGEAAHLFAPFGARGLNSGVPDAEHAALAIDAALNTESEADRLAAIQAFDAARRGAAEWNRRAAGIALRHLQARDPIAKIRLAVAASLAPYSAKAAKWLDEAPYGPTTGPDESRQVKY